MLRVKLERDSAGADLAAELGTPGDGALAARAREFVEYGQRLGYRLDELVDALQRVGGAA
jgi:hypothetical protein